MGDLFFRRVKQGHPGDVDTLKRLSGRDSVAYKKKGMNKSFSQYVPSHGGRH
jgi:hypothetical protein